MSGKAPNIKFQVVHIKLSKSRELKAKRVAKILFRYLMMMSEDLATFLGSRGLLIRKNKIVKDSQGMLYAIKNRKDVSNLLNTNGKSKRAVQRMISDAIKGRNAICHNNLPEVLRNWKIFLKSWIQVSLMIGSNKTANKIRRLLRFLSMSRKMPKKLNSDVSAITVFTNLEREFHLPNWTLTKEEASVFLGYVFYDLQLDVYSPALTESVVTKKHQCPTSVVDCHAMTELMKIKYSANDFHKPHDGSSFDLLHLQNAADGRHSAVHERKTKILLNWDSYLASMIYVAKGIGAISAARRIAKKRSQLVAARDRAKRSVNSGKPLRTGQQGQSNQPIRTLLAKTTKICRLKRIKRSGNSSARYTRK
jgi:hypothetical protein